MTPPIVLAYAGESNIADAARRLTSTGADVVTLTLDLGQRYDLEEIRDRALAAGAVRAHVLDTYEEFVRDFLLPALHAGVPQPGWSVFVSALAQALLARKLVEIAAIEGTRSVAHIEFGDAGQLDTNLKALDGTITVLALSPGNTEAADIARATIWGDPEGTSSRSLKTLDTPASVDVSFERGVPVAINGVPMVLVELVESLSIIGEKNGAAAILDTALRALETARVSPELIRMRSDQARAYAELVFGGRWFTEARTELAGLNAKVQEMVTGTVRVRLFDGRLLSSSVLEDATVSRS
ncbi:MAG: hypothetical protein HOP16_17250 [Acidobacteria bacterium]|nr:hypothetical protein [Acidobacteriota bacterium]